jgi:group I intron endonuclease
MFIYKITNLITLRCYIGMTKRSIITRFKAHCYEASVQKYNMYLHNSIRKYGKENFKIELIEECTPENLHEREVFWIKELNTIQPHGYNEHIGGKGGCLNPSPELRKKLSDARKRYGTSWNKGLTKATDERVRDNATKISTAKTGIKFSTEHKANLSKARKKRVV